MAGPFAELPRAFVETFGVKDDGSPHLATIHGSEGVATDKQVIYRRPQGSLSVGSEAEIMTTFPEVAIPETDIAAIGEPELAIIGDESFTVVEVDRDGRGMATLRLEKRNG